MVQVLDNIIGTELYDTSYVTRTDQEERKLLREANVMCYTCTSRSKTCYPIPEPAYPVPFSVRSIGARRTPVPPGLYLCAQNGHHWMKKLACYAPAGQLQH